MTVWMPSLKIRYAAEEPERQRERPHPPQRVPELPEAVREYRPGRVARHRRPVPQPQQRQRGERRPPDTRRHQAVARDLALGEPERPVERQRHQVQQEQHATADVADAPADRRHPVAVVGRGDLRQERVVHHRTRTQRHVRHQEQPGTEQEPAAGEEQQPDRGCRNRRTRTEPAVASCATTGPRSRRPPAATAPAGSPPATPCRRIPSRTRSVPPARALGHARPPRCRRSSPRYGPRNTVTTVVANAEFAQS